LWSCSSNVVISFFPFRPEEKRKVKANPNVKLILEDTSLEGLDSPSFDQTPPTSDIQIIAAILEALVIIAGFGKIFSIFTVLIAGVENEPG
jgi:hypothetical protein